MGWNGSNEAKAGQAQAAKGNGARPGARPPSALRGVLAGGACVIALGAAALWYFTRPAPPQDPGVRNKTPGAIKEVKPAPAPKAAEEPKKEEPKLGPNQFMRNGRVMTRSEGVHAYYYDKQGRKILVLNVDDGPREMQKSIFETPVEVTLSQYLEPAEDLPPPPRESFSQDEIMQALMAKIEIDPEKDSEQDQWRKQAMIAMKDELKQFIKDGGTFSQFLRQLKQRQEKEGMLMKETRNQVIQQIKDGDIEGAKALREKFNEHLTGQGLPAMKLPPPYRKALGDPVGTLKQQ